MLYCTELAILQSALQLVEKQENAVSNIEDKPSSPVHIIKLAVQEIVQGVEEDNDPEEQLTWSKKIHCVILYKILTSHYEKSLDDQCIELIQGITDNLLNGTTESKKIDGRDILSSILPPVSLSLYFNLLKESNWFDLFTEILSYLREDLSCHLIRDGLMHLQHLQVHTTSDLKLGLCFLGYMLTYISSNVSAGSVTETLALLPEILEQCCQITDSLDEFSIKTENVSDLSTGFHQVSLLVCFCNKAETTENLQKWFLGNTLASRIGTVESEKQLNFTDYFGKYTRDNKPECFLELNKNFIDYLRDVLSLKSLLNFLIKLMSLGGQAFSCSLLGSLTSDSESRFVSVYETQILMYQDYVTSKSHMSKVSVMIDSRNLSRQVVRSLSAECYSLDVRDTCDTIRNYLSTMLESAISGDDVFPNISITAAIWRIQERQKGFRDFLLDFVKSPIASLWTRDKLLSVLQSHLELLAEEELMMEFYELVWKLNNMLPKTQFEKLTKLLLDSFSHLSLSSHGSHVLHVYRTYRQWPKVNPISAQSLNQTLNKLTAGVGGKVLLEIHQAALQDADMVLGQLLERAVGSAHQADIVSTIFMSLQELCVCKENSARSKLCMAVETFLTNHSLNQKEQTTVVKFLQSLIKSIPDGEAVLNPEEFYLSVIVPHLSPCPSNEDALSTSLALDLGTLLLGNIQEHGKSNLDLTLSLVSAAEILNSSRILWQNNLEKVTVRQKLVSFMNQLMQFEKGEQTFCVYWIVKATMDYDCFVRMATLQACLPANEFHNVCQVVCQDLLCLDHDLDYFNLLRLAAVSETVSQILGSHFQHSLDYNTLLLTLIQVVPNLIMEEWNQLFKFLQHIISSEHLSVSIRMQGILPLVNLQDLSRFLPLSQLLCDLLKLLTYSQCSTGSTEYCIQAAMAVYKNVVLNEISTVPSKCGVFLLAQCFSHITMATEGYHVGMLNSVHILLLDIVCQLEELCKADIDTAQRDQVSWIRKMSSFIHNTETKEMVQKKVSSILH